MKWKIKTGNFLFKIRSFTPIPFILLVIFVFKPVNLSGGNTWIHFGGLFIALLGEALRIFAVGYSFEGTSGRENYLRADTLNTTGIYSITRNPLYIGNFFIFTGLIAAFSNIWALIVFDIFLFLQYYFIIQAEEDFLKRTYGDAYRTYCSKTRRILPVWSRYQKNRNRFNLKKVVLKENDSIFNLLAIFLLILLYKEKVLYGIIRRPIDYILPGVVIIVAYAAIKIVKKLNR
ncbi:MAG: methyltransferase family protein [Candidatus Omnitrophota bacterium]